MIIIYLIARIWYEGTQYYMKLFDAHKMTRNITINKVHVAATELQQLLKQNTNIIWRRNRTKAAVRLKKINRWKSRGTQAYPIKALSF